jgi:hypothetical protein
MPHDHRTISRGDRSGDVHAQQGSNTGAFTRSAHLPDPAFTAPAGLTRLPGVVSERTEHPATAMSRLSDRTPRSTHEFTQIPYDERLRRIIDIIDRADVA